MIRSTTKAVAALAIGALVLTACSSDKKKDTASTASSATSAAVAASSAAASQPATADLSKVKVSYVSGMKALPFYVSVNCGATARAKELGIQYEYNGPADYDATQQIPIVNAVGAKKPDALIVTATDTKALIPPLKAVKDQGVKLVEVDGTVEDGSLSVSKVLSDNKRGGALAAKAINDLTGGKGSVVVISTKPGISSTDERGEGFKEAIKAYPGIKFLGIEYNGGSNATAQQIVTGLIAKNSDLSGVFGAGNVGSEGTAAALRAANASGRVKVVQYDASPGQVEQLQSKVLDALIAQDPYQEGIDSVNQAVAAATGQPTKDVLTDLHIITRETLADGSGKKFQYKVSC
ncbi:MAG: ABC transporter substrate-binding protein [Actinomycetota bacterium]